MCVLKLSEFRDISHNAVNKQWYKQKFPILKSGNVHNEIHTKNPPRVLWEERSGIPLRSAQTWANMTFGSCYDYVTMGTAVFRSLGLPAVVDRVPVWGRNSEGPVGLHSFQTRERRLQPSIHLL